MIKVKLKLNSVPKVIHRLGLDVSGDVQRFHTNNALNRILKYIPKDSSELRKLTYNQTNINVPVIKTIAPQAEYLFLGKKMVNAKTGKGPALIPGVGFRYKKGTVLKRTDIPLKYTTHGTGPHWDRALVANEGKVLVSELQRYIDRRKE